VLFILALYAGSLALSLTRNEVRIVGMAVALAILVQIAGDNRSEYPLAEGPLRSDHDYHRDYSPHQRSDNNERPHRAPSCVAIADT
jgi:hypothetical protein